MAKSEETPEDFLYIRSRQKSGRNGSHQQDQTHHNLRSLQRFIALGHAHDNGQADEAKG